MKSPKKSVKIARKPRSRKVGEAPARREALVDDIWMDGKPFHSGVTVFDLLGRRRKSKKSTAA